MTGRDFILSACSHSQGELEVSSLNITLLTGLGGTGSPQVQTHSHRTGREPGPEWPRFPLREGLEDFWNRLTDF